MGITLLAFLLRWVHNDLTVLHFNRDEAEYALRARYIVEHGGAYPVDKLYDHPPLWPYILAGAFAVLGTSWWTARLAAALAGTLTVPVLAWAGWSWKDQRTGLLAGAFAACLPLFVRVSRKALIEPLLGLFVAILCFGIARADDDPGRGAYGLMAVGGGGALLAKETAALLAPGVLAYVVWSRIYEDGDAWIAACGAVAVVAPVYAGMAAAGFPGIHVARAGNTLAYASGFDVISTGPGASLTFLVPLIHVLLVPLVVGVALSFVRGDEVSRSYSLMVLAALAFVAASPFLGDWYLYLLGVPGVLVSAWVGARYPKAAGAVVLVLLALSIAGVQDRWRADAIEEARIFVEERRSVDETVLANDYTVFEFFRPETENLPARRTHLAQEPAYLVLNQRYVERLSDEPAFKDYDRIHIIPNQEGDPLYGIYRHKDVPT